MSSNSHPRRHPGFPLTIRRALHLWLCAASAATLLLSFSPAAARPRLDPRLRSLRDRLAEEEQAGRTPQMLALSPDALPFPGLRVVERNGKASLGIGCLMNLGPGGREALARYGITPRTSSGDIVTVTLTPEELDVVAGLDPVTEVEMARELKPYLDVSAPLVHATEVHGGPAPGFSPTGFTGRNVVVGIIDTGMDIRHDDFRKPNGATRIKFAWDQLNGAGPHPSGFGIGTEWTEAQINSQINSGTPQINDTSGHGSHVAGIAAGDGSATGNGQPAYRYVGIAPEADIILVKTNFTTDDVLDAITYVFARAGEKDAVVNLSLGTQDGPHDGTSLFDQAITNKLGPGRIVVAAAGNEGSASRPVHGRLTLGAGADSVIFTFQVPPYTPNSGTQNDNIFLDGWYEGSDNISFVVQAPSGWRSQEAGNNSRVTACSPLPGGEGRLLLDNNNTTDYPAPSNGDKELYIVITDYSVACGPPADGTWKIIAYPRGTVVSGTIDIWVSSAQLGSSQSYPWFVLGGSNSYLVGSPASAARVLSVGAFISKRSWQIQGGEYRQYNGVSDADIGRIASFSSPGPLRDAAGTIAPDLAAPGMGIGSARSTSATLDPDYLLTDGKHVINQGTSQAAPHVTGAAALLLERCPHLTPEQLFERFTQTADHDAFTGAGANNTYGYGKLNVLDALNYGTPPLACSIEGEASPVQGSTLAYSDATAGTRNRLWSIVSNPQGIASIIGSSTSSSVEVHFSGSGTVQLVLSVSDPSAPEPCRTLCSREINVGVGIFSTLEAVSEPGQVRLRWQLRQPVAGLQSFVVRRADSPQGTYSLLATVPAADLDYEYVDTTGVIGQSYWYTLEVQYSGEQTELFGPLLGSPLPLELALGQNAANPFADQTVIFYVLPETGPVRIDVFDLGGRLVRTLLDESNAPAGRGEVTWNGHDASGQESPSGIYFYQLTSRSRTRTKKMILLRR